LFCNLLRRWFGKGQGQCNVVIAMFQCDMGDIDEGGSIQAFDYGEYQVTAFLLSSEAYVSCSYSSRMCRSLW